MSCQRRSRRPDDPGHGQHQYRDPVIGPVDGKDAVFCGQPGIVGHFPADVLRGEKIKEGLPVIGVDVPVGDGTGVPRIRMGQLGFRQRGIFVPVHDTHGIRIEHDLVDFGIAVLEGLVEIGFLVEPFGDVAQQEQGMVVRSGMARMVALTHR